MSRAVCVMIRAGGRIVGEGRSRVLDRAKFLLMSQSGQPVLASKAPRCHHEMAAGAREKVAGAALVFSLMETGHWL